MSAVGNYVHKLFKVTVTNLIYNFIMKKNGFLQTTVLIIIVLVVTYFFVNGLVAMGYDPYIVGLIGCCFMIGFVIIMGRAFQSKDGD